MPVMQPSMMLHPGWRTSRGSAATPINRDDARSGVVAIRRRPLQPLVVHARSHYLQPDRGGPGAEPVGHLEGQVDMS